MNLGVIVGLLISADFSFLFSKLFVMNFFKKSEKVIFKVGMINDSLSLLFIEFSLH